MADLRSLVVKNGTTQGITTADTLIVGNKVDAQAGQALTVGGTNATGITIGQASITTSFPGPVNLAGDVTTVGGTTFTTDATFEGAVTFGTGDASDTVTFFSGTTVINDIAFNGAGYRVTNMLDPLAAQDGATKAYADTKLALTGGTMSGAINMGSQQITNLANGTASTDAINLSQLNAVAAIEYDQQIFVSDGADPLVATGAPLRPFASISAAMAAITDASPTKRYAISVAAGEYTEASALNLKPNVFIVGVGRDAVRITAPSYALDASFTGGADNRSGISNAIVTGAASFNFTTVTSTAGKLYFRDTSFVSAVTLTGYNNATVQAQFSGCQMSGVFTVQGVNVGVFNDNILFSNIVLTQSPFGGVPTFLVATGGSCGGTVTATTTVNDFNRRISVFARSFWMNGAVTVDGPSSYLDYTVDSLPSGGASTPNGGNLVSIDYGANKALSNLVYPTAVNNPIIPASTNATNMGDWSKQWFFSFSYVYLSTGTDLYIGSAGTSAVPDSAGRAVFLQPDQYGIDVNVNGGVLDLRTANATGTGISGNVDILTGTSVNGNSGSITLTTGAPSGSGTRGVISLNGREIDANSVKITNLANGTNPSDAVNFSQLSAIVSGVSAVSATAPLLSSGGATPDISIDTAGANNGDVLTYNGAAWAAAAPSTTSAQGGANAIQYANATTPTDFDGDNAKFTFTESTSVMGIAGGGATLSVDSASLTTTASALDIEGAASVTASITGGATYLLTPSSVQTGFPTSGAITLDLDPSLTPYKQIGALTGDISFANASNPGAARSITVEIIGDTVSRNITAVPAGWKWLGGAAPTVIEANKTAILSIACFGASNNDVVASWSYDGSTAITGTGVDNQIAVWAGTQSLDSSSGLTWNSATAAFAADGSAVFNESGANRDFRVEAVGNANMLFVDASQASVSIGTTGATHAFNIGSGSSANFCVASGGRIHTYDGSAPTDGQILIGDTVGGNFAKATLTAGTNIAVTNGAGSITVGLTGQVAVANGGTGQSTLTSGALVVGNGGSAVNTLSPGSNGDVLTVVGGAWVSQSLPAATDYSVVSITTAVSQGDAVTVAGAAAIATAASTSRVAGIVSATANKVSVLGIVEDCNFDGSLTLAVGDAVYLSAANAGKLTNVAPSASGEVVAELGIIAVVNTVGGGAAAADVLWQPKSIVIL